MTHINLTPALPRASALALLVPGIAQALIALDYAIVYVALPGLATALHLTQSEMQWVVSLYGLVFAGCLLLGGTLCDRFGARRMFTLGMALFLLASVVGGLAHNAALLLIARGGQGVAAALLQPAILALLAQRFQGDAHRRALAVWSAVGAFGLVAGVLLGGVLTALSWRTIFFINIPPGLLALWRIGRDYPFFIAAKEKTHTGVGTWLGCASAGAVVWALMRYAETGSADFIANRLALGMVVLFILHERFARHPLWSPALRGLPGLQSGGIASACYMASVGSQFYAMTLLWQQSYHLDAVTTGLLFTPLALMIVMGNGLYARLSIRFSHSGVLTAGFAAAAIGLWLLSLSLNNPFSVGFVLGIVLSGTGHGLIYPAMFAVGLVETPPTLQGRASAVMITSQYTAGAVMLAMITVLAGAHPTLESWVQVFHWLSAAAGIGMCVALCATGK
jgi:DHA2 family methylenomycin A resistance protein-like MFS transporter